MKKQLLTICLLLATAVTFAQTPRLSLYEEFTGETCPPCAATNPGLNVKLASPTNTPLVVAIKWQVPIPSAPSNTWSLYKSDKSEIDIRAAYYPSQDPNGAITNYINSAPQGRFDGQHQWTFGATSDHPTYVSNAIIATAQSYTSAFSVVLAREMDQSNAAFNVTVNIVATAPYQSVGALVFRTVMVDRLIQFSVQPGTNGEKNFEDIAVRSFPNLTSGVSLKNTWAVGESKTFTLNCPIPANILAGDHNRSTANLDFVGFIQDNGNKKVAQAVRGSDCSYINASTASSTVCVGDGVLLTGSGSPTDNYSWSTGESAASIIFNATADTTIYITSNDPDACPNRGEISLSVTECTGIKKLSANALQVEVYPNPSKGDFVVKTDFTSEKTHMVIFNNLGQKVYDQAINSGETSVKANLAKGLYSYEILQNTRKVNVGKLVVE